MWSTLTIYEAFGALDLHRQAFVGLCPRVPKYPPAKVVLAPGATLVEAELRAAEINAGGGIELMSLQLSREGRFAD